MEIDSDAWFELEIKESETKWSLITKVKTVGDIIDAAKRNREEYPDFTFRVKYVRVIEKVIDI